MPVMPPASSEARRRPPRHLGRLAEPAHRDGGSDLLQPVGGDGLHIAVLAFGRSSSR
jgi:hypothetical protein